MGILKIISFENSAKMTNTLCVGALDPGPKYPSKSGLTVAANIYFKIVFSHPADTCHPVLRVLLDPIALFTEMGSVIIIQLYDCTS